MEEDEKAKQGPTVLVHGKREGQGGKDIIARETFSMALTCCQDTI